MPEPIQRLFEPLLAAATILVIAGLAVAPFLTPMWVSFEQERAQATAWTGYTTDQVRTATDAILADLVVGPPDFDVEIDGVAVLNEREREHLRDVRDVFAAFAVAVLLGALALIAGRRALGPERWRAALRRGATWAVVAIVAGGIIAVAAFDAAFEIFHQLFFTGGSYTFDPRTERVVQLFPNQFWLESTIAVGAVIAGIALIVRRAARPSDAHTARAGDAA